MNLCKKAFSGIGFFKYRLRMKTNKNLLKLVLDATMIILFVLMYKKNVISLGFHEIAGLIVLGASLIHVAINYKWVVGITKRIFDRKLPKKTRIQYATDMLLIADVILMLVSSIMISKVVFPSVGGDRGWQVMHYFFAAVLVGLIGVHFGLHFSNIRTRVLGTRKLNKALSMFFIALAIALVAFGMYSFTNTSILRYLTGPFSFTSGEFTHEMSALPPTGTFDGNQFHGAEQTFSILNAGSLFLSYFSIIFTIGLATHGLTLIKRRPKKQLQLANQMT